MLIDGHGDWISFLDMDTTMLIWTYITYGRGFFLSPILIFLICLVMTYKEDISHYGIRASIWMVPTIIAEGFIFYFGMFGFCLDPFILQFAYFEGYLNILILFGLTLSGSISGMKLKQLSVRKKRKILS
ncbi:MAG: hypothetical protein EU533_02705 [Promethearchaeota archaeon]|nr:MAG: hypothetical protein EU533_02705 [Candidatus Lokiarchaeota archaeon]